MIKQILPITACLMAACTREPVEKYGFIAKLGNDTVSVESVSRSGNRIVSDEVDRFPRVRQRHTEIDLEKDGRIRHLVMDIHTPSEPDNQRDRRVVADVTSDSVHITKRDESGTVKRSFATGGAIAMAHLPQMYSLYDLYFAAALTSADAAKQSAGDTVRMRQFYIDREFDNFPLHRGFIRIGPDNKAEIWHDWLSGTGEATLDSTHHLVSYSGARTTYTVDVARVAALTDVKSIGDRFAALESQKGKVTSLSVRDTVRATIGSASFMIDYGRPLARGRELLGNVIAYDRVWRTGANAATQFSTSAPIMLAGLSLAPGMYTLWTVPHANGVELIVNKQTGQWGTQYNPAFDLGKAPIDTEPLSAAVEEFTISIDAKDAAHGSLVMEWGPFRWAAPIIVK
jgi:hypothetical protein